MIPSILLDVSDLSRFKNFSNSTNTADLLLTKYRYKIQAERTD